MAAEPKGRGSSCAPWPCHRAPAAPPTPMGLRRAPTGLRPAPTRFRPASTWLRRTPTRLRPTPKGLRRTPKGLRRTPTGLRATRTGLGRTLRGLAPPTELPLTPPRPGRAPRTRAPSPTAPAATAAGRVRDAARGRPPRGTPYDTCSWAARSGWPLQRPPPTRHADRRTRDTVGGHQENEAPLQATWEKEACASGRERLTARGRS